MSKIILTLEIRYERDVVMARQRARQIAELLGFDSQDQTRIATAVSEICRNAFQYAGGGKVEFCLDGETAQSLTIRVCDRGKGIANLKTILDGRYTSATGMGLGIVGTRRLMDRFHIESIAGQGTTVLLGKNLPGRVPSIGVGRLGQIADELIQLSPQDPLEEVQQQNQELLRTLAQLRQREEELLQLNQELEDTNRGVVALYAELDEKAESLKRANELKTHFLSNMSHEFRTPLNSIVSLSNLLLNRMDGELTLDQEKQVNFIRKAAIDLSELVNDLLDLAKVEAGKIEVHPSSFEVSELFGTLRGMLRPLLTTNSSVSLIVEEPDEVPTLYSDENKVAQILRNFISNALKYTERGEVRVSASRTGNNVTFSVADTGIGIAVENRERIFEEFVQIDSSLQKRIKGTGLGLPLSRKLAKLLGGNISLTSELGVGSTFSASIPLIYSGDTPQGVKSDRQEGANRLSVLVVGDNLKTLFTYEKYFQQSCYQMVPAQTLDQVGQALQSFKPDAVILDVLLTSENTLAFLAQMRKNETIRDIPILVVTVIDREKKAIALGADACLIEPVDGWLVLNTLNRLTRRGMQQKLLLIDDDPAYRYLFKELLDGKGIDFLEATEGHDGISLARVEKPQAIVLDLVMPQMSGFEVLEQLENDPATRQIPVIINTSKRLEAEERKHLSRYALTILSKESPSQEVGFAQIRDALVRAGLVVEIEE